MTSNSERAEAFADRLTQLAQQFVASLHFVHRRHDLGTLSPDDKVRDFKQEQLNEG